MKKYIIGGLVGASLMFSMQAFAAVGDKVEAIFAQFNFIVNGVTVGLDESPVVINGNSYLPVRSISNALGYDVTYKADSRTIEMSVAGNTYENVPTPTVPVQSTPSPIQPTPSNGQTNATPPSQQASGDDKYAGKVFVSGKDLFEAIMNDTGEMITYTSKSNSPVIVYNKKENIIDKNDQFYDMDNRQGYYQLKTIESFIPSKYLNNIPKYQISNGVVTKK
jgi:hypothetical protein